MEPTLVATSALAALAGPAAAWWHHARWVAYHRLKGEQLPLTTRWSMAMSESTDLATIGAWYLRAWFQDGLRVPAESTGNPVVCVHGYTQNGTNFWGIRQALEARGRPTLALSLVHRLAPLSWYTGRLERHLDRLGEGPVDIVCHSMGGILLRAVLARRDDLCARVNHVVTLGSPHAGTAAARGIPWVPEVQALKRRSSFLEGLPDLVSLVPRVTNVAGSLDTIVYPVLSALEPDARHVVLPVGHAGLLVRQEAIDAVVDAIVAGTEPSAGPR